MRYIIFVIIYLTPGCADSAVTDPLVHRGCHFGRVAYAFCSIKVLVTNGLLRMANDDPHPIETIA